jgi:pSer/pThr/pTyr-binding forkhead associated (FHA) protein
VSLSKTAPVEPMLARSPMDKEARDQPTTTTASIEEAQNPILIRQIRVVHAPVLPKRAVAILESSSIVIGRESDDEVGIGIPDREISRRHAVLELEGGTWFARDLESRNGLFVNGVRETRAALRDGSVIRAGKALLLYQELEL